MRRRAGEVRPRLAAQGAARRATTSAAARVPEARTILAFTARAPPRATIEKVLRSRRSRTPSRTRAALERRRPRTSTAAYVDEGPTMKRWRAPRARPRRTGSASARATSRSRSSAARRRSQPPPQRQQPAGTAEGARQPAGRRLRRDDAKTRRRSEATANGPESSSRRPARRRHPRLEVELDGRQEGVRRRPASRTSRSASTSTGSSSHAGLSDILIRKDKQRITVDIYTARPGIVIGKSGVEVDALRKELHAMTAEERPHQHQRDQAARSSTRSSSRSRSPSSSRTASRSGAR